MKTKLIWMMLLIVAATTVTIISCKKQDAVAQEESTEIFKTIVKDWQKKTVTISSLAERKIIDSIVLHLDYS
jgi:hypothetical protein